MDRPSRTASSIRTASVSASAPDLGGHGATYVEVAVQGLSNPPGQGSAPDAGQAAYGSVSVNEKPVFVSSNTHRLRQRALGLLGPRSNARTALVSASRGCNENVAREPRCKTIWWGVS